MVARKYHSLYHKTVKVGDLAVIDISAKTIDEDGSTGEAIPDAESKGYISTEPFLFTPFKTCVYRFANEC